MYALSRRRLNPSGQYHIKWGPASNLDPFENENKLKTLQPQRELLDLELGRAKEQALRDLNVGGEERRQHERKAVTGKLAKQELKARIKRETGRINDQFSKDFMSWLLGKDPVDPKNPAYVKSRMIRMGLVPNPGPMRGDGINEYVGSFIDTRADFLKKVTYLRMGPHKAFKWNLKHFWLYYKYILRGLPYQEDLVLAEFADFFPDGKAPREGIETRTIHTTKNEDDVFAFFYGRKSAADGVTADEWHERRIRFVEGLDASMLADRQTLSKERDDLINNFNNTIANAPAFKNDPAAIQKAQAELTDMLTKLTADEWELRSFQDKTMRYERLVEAEISAAKASAIERQRAYELAQEARREAEQRQGTFKSTNVDVSAATAQFDAKLKDLNAQAEQTIHNAKATPVDTNADAPVLDKNEKAKTAEEEALRKYTEHIKQRRETITKANYTARRPPNMANVSKMHAKQQRQKSSQKREELANQNRANTSMSQTAAEMAVESLDEYEPANQAESSGSGLSHAETEQMDLETVKQRSEEEHRKHISELNAQAEAAKRQMQSLQRLEQARLELTKLQSQVRQYAQDWITMPVNTELTHSAYAALDQFYALKSAEIIQSVPADNQHHSQFYGQMLEINKRTIQVLQESIELYSDEIKKNSTETRQRLSEKLNTIQDSLVSEADKRKNIRAIALEEIERVNKATQPARAKIESLVKTTVDQGVQQAMQVLNGMEGVTAEYKQKWASELHEMSQQYAQFAFDIRGYDGLVDLYPTVTKLNDAVVSAYTAGANEIMKNIFYDQSTKGASQDHLWAQFDSASTRLADKLELVLNHLNTTNPEAIFQDVQQTIDNEIKSQQEFEGRNENAQAIYGAVRLCADIRSEIDKDITPFFDRIFDITNLMNKSTDQRGPYVSALSKLRTNANAVINGLIAQNARFTLYPMNDSIKTTLSEHFQNTTAKIKQTVNNLEQALTGNGGNHKEWKDITNDYDERVYFDLVDSVYSLYGILQQFQSFALKTGMELDDSFHQFTQFYNESIKSAKYLNIMLKALYSTAIEKNDFKDNHFTQYVAKQTQQMILMPNFISGNARATLAALLKRVGDRFSPDFVTYKNRITQNVNGPGDDSFKDEEDTTATFLQHRKRRKTAQENAAKKRQQTSNRELEPNSTPVDDVDVADIQAKKEQNATMEEYDVSDSDEEVAETYQEPKEPAEKKTSRANPFMFKPAKSMSKRSDDQKSNPEVKDAPATKTGSRADIKHLFTFQKELIDPTNKTVKIDPDIDLDDGPIKNAVKSALDKFKKSKDHSADTISREIESEIAHALGIANYHQGSMILRLFQALASKEEEFTAQERADQLRAKHAKDQRTKTKTYRSKKKGPIPGSS